MPAERLAPSMPVSRRGILALPAAVAAATLAAPLLVPEVAVAAGTGHPHRRLVDRRLAAPVKRAYHYLDVVHDAYLRGKTPRLLQSYNNESQLMTTAFVYDNALALIAYLAHPTKDNIRRARLIGDALLWVQANDEKFNDGRVRQAYAAGPMLFFDGTTFLPGMARLDGKAAHMWPYGFSGSATGDMAWAGLALVQLYAKTKIKKYLDGAVTLGQWISDKVSPFRFGGYHGGLQADGVTAQRWCATEHNIDVYAFFHLLRKHTHDKRWVPRAKVAGDFVRAMWNAERKHFWTGTVGGLPNEDPNLINTRNLPEDTQTWAMLGMGDCAYDDGADWVLRHLSNTDDGPGSQLPPRVKISGVTYSSQAKTITGKVSGSDLLNNRRAVWLEGNGHLAAALLHRGRQGDKTKAVRLLRQTVVAQKELGAGQTVGLTRDPVLGRLSDPKAGGTWTGTPLPADSGIVAASSAFDTGFEFGYFQRQHVGATAWFLMAAQRFNPFV